MKGKSALFWLGLAAAAGGVLFQTSYEVQELEEQLGSLNRKIMEEQEAIQILKAEWSYLNDPTRLESLASQHLALQPTDARQFVALDVVPMRPAGAEVVPPAGPKMDPAAPLPPMVRLSPPAGQPAAPAVASNTGASNTGTTLKAGIIPASAPAKPAPIKPSAIIPAAAKAPALPGAQPAAVAKPAPISIKPTDVAARPLPAPTTVAAVPAAAPKTLSVPPARQPQSAAVSGSAHAAPPPPPSPPRGTDSIGVLVARLGANR
ncbi:cell division protein FtsL [Azospirillum sp. sgz302134]